MESKGRAEGKAGDRHPVLRRLLQDEHGQGLTEYALIIVLVSVAVAGILAALGLRARGLLELVTLPPG